LKDVSITYLIECLSEEKTYEEHRFVCEFCSSSFKSPQSKYYHKQHCKAKDEKIATQERIALLEKEVHRLNQVVNSKVSNVNNTQNNINIQINVRDFAMSENTTYLDKSFLLECFKDMDLVKVLEEIHFNPEHPENHNVRIKNVKQNLMEYVNDGKWVVKKKDEVLEHLIMNGYRVLHTYYKKNKDDVEDELEDFQVDESLQWLRKIYDEDKSLYKELKNDAFLLVMNNKALLIGK
jgi:hypothetical protein